MTAFQIIFYIVIISVPAVLFWIFLFGRTPHWPPRRKPYARRGPRSAF